jgi:hypothetical protein
LRVAHFKAAHIGEVVVEFHRSPGLTVRQLSLA